MSEYAGSTPKREKIIRLTPDEETGALFTIEDAPVDPETVPVEEVQPTDDPVEQVARERAAYENALRGQGLAEERLRQLVGKRFGPRIARLAIRHDVSRLLPPEPISRAEAEPVYRDVRSAAANDRTDD